MLYFFHLDKYMFCNKVCKARLDIPELKLESWQCRRASLGPRHSPLSTHLQLCPALRVASHTHLGSPARTSTLHSHPLQRATLGHPSVLKVHVLVGGLSLGE